MCFCRQSEFWQCQDFERYCCSHPSLKDMCNYKSKIFSLYLKRLQRRQHICRLLLIKLSQNSFMEVLIAACLSRCILYACIYGNPSLEKNLSWQICRRFLATTDYWPVLGHFGAQQPVWMTTKKPFSYNMTVQVLGEGCKNLR